MLALLTNKVKGEMGAETLAQSQAWCGLFTASILPFVSIAALSAQQLISNQLLEYQVHHCHGQQGPGVPHSVGCNCVHDGAVKTNRNPTEWSFVF